ncbi:MAG: EutN/CcmL family microcompartment protein [Anaerolineales bacterium]|nr:EutN/CcmL family microcompartment protein [Anaerolineales bacterium]
MQLARVRGNAVCTIKYSDLQGAKLLVVELLDQHLEPRGSLQVAVDVVQAGMGDLCMLARSREAALALDPTFVPVDLAIVGIVDELNVQPDGSYDVTLKPGHTRYS